jgi:4-hydroxy-2-oxoglutarate aldolase
VLLYNVTMYTGVNLPSEAVARLATHPNIVGMKESGSDLVQIADLIARTPDDFTILAGSASTLFPALAVGCDGGILALAALAPDACVQMVELVRAGRVGDARALQARLMPLSRAIGSQHGVPGLKAAMDLLGYVGGPPRPPLRPVAPQTVETLRSQLAALDLLEQVAST